MREESRKASTAPEKNIKEAKVERKWLWNAHGWVRSESGPALDYLGGKIGGSRNTEVGGYKLRVEQKKQYHRT
jgi:hypothetical protein